MELNKRVRRKNRRKAFRVTLQAVVLLGLAWILLQATVLADRYQPAADADRTQREAGFVALSYFGVAEEGTDTLISRDLLEKHLQALSDAGFQTISQQDIIDYYQHGASLPENALFLFFEDGRRQSAIYAQPLLEKHNYLASMLSYANNLDGRQELFLSAAQLRSMEDSSYWELGTNGYRLGYINVFDRHEQYLGELTPIEFYTIAPYVRREYNHYLMDFLRDAYDIPMETQEGMAKRIEADYLLMREAYERQLGELPPLYALMHANTGAFATNGKVSAENERWIGELFAINFNREMYSRNDLASDIRDLTRMQPQAYWPVNHLLMRIGDDTGREMPFRVGDAARAAQWELQRGAAEFEGDAIYLTSLSRDQGILRLRESAGMGDFHLSVRLTGNRLGVQSIDLLLDGEGESRLSIEIRNNVLRVYPFAGEGEPEEAALLVELDLDEHDEIVYQTWEENRQEALLAEIPAKEQQAYKPEEAREIARELTRLQKDTSGANHEDYVPEITLKDPGDRQLELTLRGDILTIAIDGKVAAGGIEIPGAVTGGIALRCAWAEYGYSQRNLADDVYDGIFRGLVLTRADGETLLDYRAVEPETLLERAQDEAVQAYGRVAGWVEERVIGGGESGGLGLLEDREVEDGMELWGM